MKVKQFTRRVYNSPLVKFTNFENNGHINLIHLRTPYSNGMQWAIHNTTGHPTAHHAIFANYEKAITAYNQMEAEASKHTPIYCTGVLHENMPREHKQPQ